jgi:predicted O-linked N-acetylglucosamine transferase (SPINDLY family)
MIPPIFEQALEHHQAGRLAMAEALYRQVLSLDPNHAGAWHFLGVIAHQAGRNEVALHLIHRALALDPNQPEAHSNLGEVYRMLGRFGEAEASYRRALELAPNQSVAENNLGTALKAQGRLEEAEAAYRRALGIDPGDAFAYYNLGTVLVEQSRPAEAITAFQQALQIRPEFAEASNNLGGAFVGVGDIEAAVAAYRRALQSSPDHAEAHNNLGVALARQGKFEEAIGAHLRSLELRPDNAVAYGNLGNALHDSGRLQEAEATYQRALQLQPNYPEAWNSLGATLTGLGRFDEAADMSRRAIACLPTFASAYNNLGVALAKLGQFDEAIAVFTRALELDPAGAVIHNHLGMALADRGRLREAADAYRRALEIQPSYSKAHNNLGTVLAGTGKLDEAIAEYRLALEIRPGQGEIYSNLGGALKDVGRHEDGLAMLRQAVALQADSPRVHSNLVYALNFDPGQDDANLAAEQARWNRNFCTPLRPSIATHLNDPDPGRRLKIGYVSPDFRSHPVSWFFASLLEAHDREHYQIYCYADVRRSDSITRRLRAAADVWRESLKFTDTQLAECIRADGIDILVDLAMHTEDNRLPAFARKPAPVQVSWLAYPGSTGVETIDYRFTDAHLDPPGSERPGPGGKPVLLPNAWCCYTPILDFPPVGPLPAEKEKVITFGSLNQFGKLHRELLLAWAELLGNVPNSRLLIVCRAGEAQERTRAFFEEQGIAPTRVELIAPAPWRDFVSLLGSVDIALDSHPCNGLTTTCHALWMGVPVITWAGATAVSRAGSSLLHAVCLPELVAHSREEYLHLAAQLAHDLPRLQALRATMRDRMQNSPLMDAPRFARNAESAYRTMWQAWCVRPQQ